MKKKMFITGVLILTVIILYCFWPCSIKFKADSVSLLPGLLMQYLIIALLIERFVNGTILKAKSNEVNKKVFLVKKLNEEKGELIKTREFEQRLLSFDPKVQLNNNDINSAIENHQSITSKESLNLSTLREERNEDFSVFAFMIGLLLSSAGFRFFTNISEIADEICASNYEIIFVSVDVFLTSVLFAGGSRFMLELIDRFKDT